MSGRFMGDFRGRRARCLWAFLVAFSLGCTEHGGGETAADMTTDTTPNPMDAAPVADGGPMADMGALPDAGPMTDAGPMADAGPMTDAGAVVDGAPMPAPDQGASAPTRLFVIAGQSNAEGNVFYTGLRRLAEGVPVGREALSPAQRTAARRAVALSQGAWCGEDDVRDASADAVIDALRATGLEWRGFDLEYRHPTVQIVAHQFDYAPVVIRDANGDDVERCDDCDDPRCRLSPDDGALAGPDLGRYTDGTLAPLAVGYGALEDPEEGKLYGPELSFGHAIADAVPNAVILKVAMGGSSLGDHWRLDGPLYSTLITEIGETLAATDATFGGFIWFQGFNDQFESAYCEPLAEAYQNNLMAFMEAFRRDVSNAPVVIVKARNGGNLGPIQEAQDAVAAALDGVTTVETSDLSECFHYDSGAQIVIGERIAAAMVAGL